MAPSDPDAAPAASVPSVHLVQLTFLVLAVTVVLAVGGQLLHPARGDFATAPVGVGLVAAFLGGLLAFLSPCSVAVVPGFFAYAFESRGDLLRHTYVFYLGLALVFVPLGFGASLTGQFLQAHRGLLVQVAGWTMVLLGVAILLGLPMPLAGSGSAQRRIQDGRSLTGRVFLLGALFGLATSTCTAPILAGITVLSVGAGLAPLQSILLFLVFALGIATPLFLLAWAGDRTAFLERLRGRAWTLEVAGRQRTVHSSKLLTGVALVALGVLFLVTDGTRDLLGVYDALGATTLYEELDARVRAALSGWRGPAATLTVAGGALGWFAWRRMATGPGSDGPG